MHDDYVRRKHGESKVEYPLPQLEPILKETYGVILYQEQVMQIAAAVSGFSLAEADLLRRAMGKKDPGGDGGPAGPLRLRGRGPGGAQGQGRRSCSPSSKNSPATASTSPTAPPTPWWPIRPPISRPIIPWSFWPRCSTAKSTIPPPWPSTSWRPGTRGIELLPPDINHSDRDFTVEDGKVRYGLAGVKNVGVGAIQEHPGGPGRRPLRELPGCPGADQPEQGEPQGPGGPDPGRGL